MTISTKDWVNYINKLAAINKKAADLMREYVQKNGFANTDELMGYAHAVATKYGEAAAELTCQMYEATAEAQGVIVRAAEPADTPTFAEVAKTINGTKNSPETMCNAIGRLTKRTGADTMLKNALRDNAEFAWVPHADTCAFCITLASRGWQKMSKKALKNGHAEHIHANCDCQYAVRFDGKSNVSGYDPDGYLRMYNEQEGRPIDKINAIRKINYQKNKERINAQKRMSYWQKKQTGGKTYIPYDAGNQKDVKAAKEYKKISREYDAEIIAKSSGMSVEEITEIKRHIFYEKHKLYDRYDILYPDYDIAVAWKRLKEGRPEERDLVLLNHELLEARVEREGNLTLAQAHAIAKKEFDWEKALFEAVGQEGEKYGIL